MLFRVCLYALILACLVFALYPRSVRERTLQYSLGTIDPRFNISPDAVLLAARRAGDVWEDAVGRRLFRYNPQAPFRIHLHYDERQKEASQAKQDISQLQSGKSGLEELNGRYQSLRAVYDAQSSGYERDVAGWKAQGGAPPEEAARLNAQGRELNRMAGELNALLAQLKPMASSLEAEVERLNANAGQAFDRGDFTGTRIDVYQFDNEKDLTVILAHEFGHALTIEHVADPKAVMYYTKSDQDFKDPRVTADDKKALDAVCAAKYPLDPRTFFRWRAWWRGRP